MRIYGVIYQTLWGYCDEEGPSRSSLDKANQDLFTDYEHLYTSLDKLVKEYHSTKYRPSGFPTPEQLPMPPLAELKEHFKTDKMLRGNMRFERTVAGEPIPPIGREADARPIRWFYRMRIQWLFVK